jgi:hypothetical protein
MSIILGGTVSNNNQVIVTEPEILSIRRTASLDISNGVITSIPWHLETYRSRKVHLS